jgi:hypothetical protein
MDRRLFRERLRLRDQQSADAQSADAQSANAAAGHLSAGLAGSACRCTSFAHLVAPSVGFLGEMWGRRLPTASPEAVAFAAGLG